MKAHIITESLPPERSFMPYYHECDEYPFMWHFHPNYELFMQVGGSGHCIIGDYSGEFCEGDILFVGPDLPHVFYTVEKQKPGRRFSFLKIHFEESFIDNLTGSFSETFDLRRLFGDARRGVRFGSGDVCRDIIKKTETLNLTKFHSGIKSFIMFLKILEKLSYFKDREILSGQEYRGVSRGYNTERLDRICAYLHNHYKEQIALREVGMFAGASVSNLCAFFKKSTGMTIIDYVNSLRISHACRLLSESEESIMNIALDSGYNTLSNFNRKFRKLRHTSPRDFRKSRTC